MIPAALKQQLLERVKGAVTNREATIDIIKAIQNHYGWLTDQAVLEASEILGLSPLQIDELASFYEFIYRKPVGQRVIHVCDSISCWSTGMGSLLRYISDSLGISVGQTTPDGLFTLLPCNCLGHCGDGPTMMIDGRIHGKVTPELASELIATERSTLASP
jgi:NADH-quinone oxidoreductase subunit E